MPFQKMEGDVPENGSEKAGEVSFDLLPTHKAKTLLSMKAPYAVKRITFDRSEANPGDTLDVHVPKLNENEVFVPGSLALHCALTSTSLAGMPTNFSFRTYRGRL